MHVFSAHYDFHSGEVQFVFWSWSLHCSRRATKCKYTARVSRPPVSASYEVSVLESHCYVFYAMSFGALAWIPTRSYLIATSRTFLVFLGAHLVALLAVSPLVETHPFFFWRNGSTLERQRNRLSQQFIVGVSYSVAFIVAILKLLLSTHVERCLCWSENGGR